MDSSWRALQVIANHEKRVLRGDMRMVGPRPKLAQYAAIPNMPYRPGITGCATIAFRSEEEILRHVAPQQINGFHAEYIKPKKAKLDVCYMCRATVYSDLRIVATTFLSCIVPAHIPPCLPPTAATLNTKAISTSEKPRELTAVEN